MQAEQVIEWVCYSLDNIDQMYYGNCVNEDMFMAHNIDEHHPHRRALEQYLARYGERFFCYELYHHVRMSMEIYCQEHPPAPADPRIYFQAELRKAFIGDVLGYFAQVDRPLEREYIPDFLLHAPGDFDHQELIVEVKSNPTMPIADLRGDLEKLDEFIARYRYRFGLFLTVNTDVDTIQRFLNELHRSRWCARRLSHRDRIVLVQKTQQNAPTCLCRLDNPQLAVWDPR